MRETAGNEKLGLFVSIGLGHAHHSDGQEHGGNRAQCDDELATAGRLRYEEGEPARREVLTLHLLKVGHSRQRLAVVEGHQLGARILIARTRALLVPVERLARTLKPIHHLEKRGVLSALHRYARRDFRVAATNLPIAIRRLSTKHRPI